MFTWLANTLRAFPEIAIFLALAIGYGVGNLSYRGFSIGAVTATLVTALAIGQLGIEISPTVKATFFLLFLFAVGYGIGPQFVRSVAKDGWAQALFAVVVSAFYLATAIVAARVAGYDVGSAAGLYAGSVTISASMGLATDAINRLGLSPDETKTLLDAIPVAYAVTYIFGTVGSILVLAHLGPKLLGIDLRQACKDYETRMSDGQERGGPGSAWRRWELRAFRIRPGAPAAGMTCAEAEALVSDARVFVERIRRDGTIREATAATVLLGGDIVALAGPREILVNLIGQRAPEVDDPELLDIIAEGVEVYVTNRRFDGMTLARLAVLPEARGVFLRRIVRGVTAVSIPILPNTMINRGDILTIVGRTQDTTAVARLLGRIDRPSDVADVAFIGSAITLGALVGALVLEIRGVPLTLSTAGGVLMAGLIFGWLRSVRPVFGHIPSSTVWFMNSVGLNVFIAVIGISAAPGFVKGLQTLGVGLFLWGMVVTTIPLFAALLAGKYVFRFDPAVLLGCCAGASASTSALGPICETARSRVPALGYSVTYAVGNTLLTIWGLILVMLLT
jgi:putative transport protein